jgi:hypothetical protein
MAANWWYNLVARNLNLDHVRLVCENAAQKLRIEELEKQVKSLTDDAAIIAAGVRERFRTGGNRDAAAMNMLREALRNEKAYTLFLEDSLECKNPSEVFNALPLEKRKEYFDKVQ